VEEESNSTQKLSTKKGGEVAARGGQSGAWDKVLNASRTQGEAKPEGLVDTDKTHL